MDRLTGLDGAFLSLESPTTHLHILGALVFDPSEVDGGVRLPADPGPGGRPAAPGAAVPASGWSRCPSACSTRPWSTTPTSTSTTTCAGPASPRRAASASWPPWWPTWPRDRSTGAGPCGSSTWSKGWRTVGMALVPKVHHAIIDGVSGAEVMAAFFDLSPDPAPRPLFGPDRGPARPRPPGTAGSAGRTPSRSAAAGGSRWSPDPLPGELDQWRDVLGSLPGQPTRWCAPSRGPCRTARSLSSRNRERPGTLPPSPFEAPRDVDQPGHLAPPAGGLRRTAAATTCAGSATVLGGTTNDVVLAVTAGAMRTLLRRAGRAAGQVAGGAGAGVGARPRRSGVPWATGCRPCWCRWPPGSRTRRPGCVSIRDGTCGRPRSRAASSAPEVFAGWAEALSRRWPPG